MTKLGPMDGHYFLMPFKPYGQEEWLDTSDEDMDESDFVEDDDSDEDYDEEWVPSDSKIPSKGFSVQLRRTNTSVGNFRQHPLHRSQTPGLNNCSLQSDKDSTTTSTSAPATTSKRSTSMVSFKEDKQAQLPMNQATLSESSSESGTKTQAQPHLQQQQQEETHKSTEETTKTSEESSTTEQSLSSPHPQNKVTAKSLRAKRSASTKSSKASDSKCK